MYYDMKKYIDYNYYIALQDSFEKQLCSFFDEITVLNNYDTSGGNENKEEDKKIITFDSK